MSKRVNAGLVRTDPFTVKQYAKWHPLRLSFTLKARLIEQLSKYNFEKYSLPEKQIDNLNDKSNWDLSNTEVTQAQMRHLLYALTATEHMQNSVVVEIGSYRGMTTKTLAESTRRRVVAVDPYIGYGGSSEDYLLFQRNTNDLGNVIHKRCTSGEAFRSWCYGDISFVFIDAVHDYVNTAFDVEAWLSLLSKDGMIAMHDTDELCFAGTRKAAFEASLSNDLFAHINGLTILRKV